MNNSIKVGANLGDTEDSFILPEVVNVFAGTGKNKPPTFYDELSWLENQIKNHKALGASTANGLAGPARKSFAKSFFRLKETQAKHYAKNLDFLKQDPQNKDFRDIFLNGARLGRYIPFESMRPTSMQQKAQGYRLMELDEELQEDGKRLTIGFDPNNFPTDLTVDTSDKHTFNYNKITPANTKFFPDGMTAAKAIQPLKYLYVNPKRYSISALADMYNELSDSDSDKFDREQDPSYWSFKGFATQLARVSTEDENPEFKPVNSKLYNFQSGLKSKGLKLDLSYYNLWSSFGDEGEDQTAFQESVNNYNKNMQYWNSKGFNAQTTEQLRSQLAQKVSQLRWEKMPEEDKLQVKQTLGSLSSFYPEIQTDADGLGAVNQNGYFDPRLNLISSDFLSKQSALFAEEEPEDWNTDLSKKSGLVGRDYFLEESEKLQTSIMRTMQRMMKYRSSAKEGEGQLVYPEDPEERLAVQKRQLDLIETSTAVVEGLGMEGASQDEMNQLVDIIAQYLELANQAAIRGVEFESFKDNKPSTYTKNNLTYLYDFKRRLGGTEVSNDYWKEVGGQELDPVYKLVSDFIADAENYVVLAGRDGKKVIPLVSWLGLSTEGDLNLSNRVSSIRLSGTGISNKRKLQQLEDGWFFKTPLETKTISGSSKKESNQKTTKTVDLGKAATVLKLDQESNN